jgi:hypothetical protein
LIHLQKTSKIAFITDLGRTGQIGNKTLVAGAFAIFRTKCQKSAIWRSFGGLLDFSYGMSQRPFDLSCEKYENLNYMNNKNCFFAICVVLTWTAWYRSIDDIVYMFLTFLSCFIASYFIGTLSNLCMANKRIYCCTLCLNEYKYYDDVDDFFFLQCLCSNTINIINGFIIYKISFRCSL